MTEPTPEQRRKAKAVGQAHTVREYQIHDGIRKANPMVSNDRAWRITMSQAPKTRGRRPKR